MADVSSVRVKTVLCVVIFMAEKSWSILALTPWVRKLLQQQEHWIEPLAKTLGNVWVINAVQADLLTNV